MNNARSNILARLRTAQRPDMDLPEAHDLHRFDWSIDEKVHRFTERMQAVQTEVHHASPDTWLDMLQSICQSKNMKNVLLSPATPWGKSIAEQNERFPTLRNYDEPIEAWKRDMFNTIDAAFTSTYGGIAETGTLILWPDTQEPRLMSLVPPVHIALLEKTKIYSTFAAAIEEQNWLSTGIPTNIVLISGPSKSADIEQTMTYGVHGPKALVVILV